MNVDPLQTDPPTIGRIQLRTSAGDVEIGLFSKEAPRACRNIVQLALEGYYDDQIFHRIVPDFIVQTGDPTGTGRGGSSIYSTEENPTGAFANELHHRLKFTKRGLVAMANAGSADSNESQFFITLGPTPELQGKHTIFGKIDGPGIYTVLSIAESELVDEESGRPKAPPKLLGVDVLDNPFDDIQPRTTREQRQAQAERAQREKQAAKEKRRRAAEDKEGGGAVAKRKKVATLLSFGEGEEGAEDAGPVATSSKGKETKLDRKKMSAFDALPGVAEAGSSSSSSANAAAIAPAKASKTSSRGPPPSEAPLKTSSKGKERASEELDLASLRAAHEAGSAKSKADAKIKELEASIRGGSSSAAPNGSASAEKGKASKSSLGKDFLAEQRAKYAAGKKGKGESDAMKKLRLFQEKLRSKEEASAGAKAAAREKLEGDEEIFPEMREYGYDDDGDGAGSGADHEDDWASFRAHRFEAAQGKDTKPQFTVDDYEVIDPRSATALKLGFGTEEARKKVEKESYKESGRRGRDWVDVDYDQKARRYREDQRGDGSGSRHGGVGGRGAPREYGAGAGRGSYGQGGGGGGREGGRGGYDRGHR